MNNTMNITLEEIRFYSHAQMIKEMYKLIKTLKEEIEILQTKRKMQTTNTYNTSEEADFFVKHYDSRIFEVKQIIKLIKHQYPEIYEFDSERF